MYGGYFRPVEYRQRLQDVALGLVGKLYPALLIEALLVVAWLQFGQQGLFGIGLQVRI